MNKLFSLLMNGRPVDAGWFYKNTSYVPVTARTSEISDILMADVSDERASMFAALLCWAALNTQYGAEIKKLDPNNTYAPVIRPSDKTHSDPTYCVEDLIKPIDAYRKLLLYMQDDIAATLDTNSWFDMIGASCLQLLREII